MNKSIKVKHLVSIMSDSSRIRFCECNYNGDCVMLTNIMYVGDRGLYTTYNERHINFIELHGSVIFVFI